MPLESDEIEDLAVFAHVDARLPPDRAHHILHLAERTPGLTGVTIAPELGRASRLVENDDGTHTIEVGSELSTAALIWKCAHELGEFRLKKRQPYPYIGPDVERVANQLAGALIVTRPALENLYGVFGYELGRLAAKIGTTQLITTLRLGEALGKPVALVGPHHVKRRGPDVLPRDGVLITAARRGGEGLDRRWRVVRLTDAPWCWAVLPAW